MNSQGWFLLGLTGLISLQSKGLSRVFFNTTLRRNQFKNIGTTVEEKMEAIQGRLLQGPPRTGTPAKGVGRCTPAAGTAAALQMDPPPTSRGLALPPLQEETQSLKPDWKVPHLKPSVNYKAPAVLTHHWQLYSPPPVLVYLLYLFHNTQECHHYL